MKNGLTTALILGLFSLGATLQAEDRERAIAFEKLPRTAIEFVDTYFSKDQVLFSSEETGFLEKEYTVLLQNQVSIEFNRDGKWKKVESKLNAVPQELIPNEIRSFIESKFPNMTVRELKRETRGWEVELMNGIGLEFDLKFNLVDYDD